MRLDELAKLNPQALRSQNKKRLQKLGLPEDLLTPGFQEREREARQRELFLLTIFEAMWKSGQWSHLDLPFQQIIDTWKQKLESPFYFSSIDKRPRWMDKIQEMLKLARKLRCGQFQRWNVECKRRRYAKQREAGTKRTYRHAKGSKYIEGRQDP